MRDCVLYEISFCNRKKIENIMNKKQSTGKNTGILFSALWKDSSHTFVLLIFKIFTQSNRQ